MIKRKANQRKLLDKKGDGIERGDTAEGGMKQLARAPISNTSNSRWSIARGESRVAAPRCAP